MTDTHGQTDGRCATLYAASYRGPHNNDGEVPISFFLEQIVLDVIAVDGSSQCLERDDGVVTGPAGSRHSGRQAATEHRCVRLDHQLVPGHVDVTCSTHVLDTERHQQQTTVFEDLSQWHVEPFQICCLSVVVAQTQDLLAVSGDLTRNLRVTPTTVCHV